MSHSFTRRTTMSRSTKTRGSKTPERDNNSVMQQQMNRSQRQAVLTGSVAILWDMENCPVPSEVKADDVAGNIRHALRTHSVIQGAVTFFSAYGDFNHFSRKVREGCQRTGVNLIDVPNGKKDASDKAILVDLFLFALDNAPPCTIFLISGDVDFAPALHKLGQRGYTVVLAIPSGVGVSSALCSAGRFVWDWPSVARGGGLVPAKNVARSSVHDRMAEIMEVNVSAGPPPNSRRSSVDESIADFIEIDAPAGQPPSSSRRSGMDERMADIIEMHSSARQPLSSRRKVDERVPEIMEMNASAGQPLSGRRSALAERMAEIIEMNASAGQPPSSRRSSADERMAEIIDMNASAGQPPGPPWSHDEDSDRAGEEKPDEEEKILWKSPAPPRIVDHHPVIDGSSCSKLDIAQQRNPGPSSSQAAPGKASPQGLYPTGPKEQSNQPSDARETMAVVTAHGDATESSVPVPRGISKNLATPPENLQSLKEQLVRLLSLTGSKSMELSCVLVEYEKLYGKPLFSGDYGHSHNKLVNLLERLKEWLFMRGEGAARTVHLTKNGGRLAGNLKRDSKNGRGVAKEEVEVVDAFRIHLEDAADVDDETAGEEVIVGSAMKAMQTLITESQSLLSDKDPEKSQEEHEKELEEIHQSSYDWDFGSVGSGGSVDERDNNLQDEKDVEVDESTLEQVVKPKGIRKASGLDILDMFRWELQDLLVSHACKIVVSDFVTVYWKRYYRTLDYEKFGVKDLESLIEKVSDVAIIMYEPESQLKYLVARWSHDGRIPEKTDSSDDALELL